MKNVNVIQQTKMNNARSRPCSRFLCDKDFTLFVGMRAPFPCSLVFWSVDVQVFVLSFEVPRNELSQKFPAKLKVLLQ